jgi:hypothetical protein
VEAHRVVRCRGFYIFLTVFTQMAVRFATLRVGCPFIPSNIYDMYLLVLEAESTPEPCCGWKD